MSMVVSAESYMFARAAASFIFSCHHHCPAACVACDTFFRRAYEWFVTGSDDKRQTARRNLVTSDDARQPQNHVVDCDERDDDVMLDLLL